MAAGVTCSGRSVARSRGFPGRTAGRRGRGRAAGRQPVDRRGADRRRRHADLVAAIERAGPFGAGHPEPVFAFGHHRARRGQGGRERRPCAHRAAQRRRGDDRGRRLPGRGPAARPRAEGSARRSAACGGHASASTAGAAASGSRSGSRTPPDAAEELALAALPEASISPPVSGGPHARLRAHRLAVQDVALSRRKHGFESRWARQ